MQSHNIRRTGATILAENGVSLNILKVAGSWDSSTAAEGCIDSSSRMKRIIADAVSCEPSIKTSAAGAAEKQSAVNGEKNEGITIRYHIPVANNCVFNLTLDELRHLGSTKN